MTFYYFMSLFPPLSRGVLNPGNMIFSTHTFQNRLGPNPIFTPDSGRRMSKTMPKAQQVYNNLNKALNSGMLTEAMLDEAVGVFVEALDGMKPPFESTGFWWIKSHPDAFRTIVTDPFAFVQRHVPNGVFSRSAITQKLFFEQLSATERETYLRNVVMRHGVNNGRWMRTPLEIGMSREFLAQLILDKLLSQTTEELVQAWTFVSYFLEKPLGEYWDNSISSPRLCTSDPRILKLIGKPVQRQWTRCRQNSMWGVLTQAQLMTALRYCAQKKPELILGVTDRLWGWLHDQLLEEIVMLALNHLETVYGNKAFNAQLTFQEREALCQRLRPLRSDEDPKHTAAFLVETCLQMGPAGAKFFAHRFNIFAQTDLTRFYEGTYPILHDAYKNRKKPGAQEMGLRLEEELEKAGYGYGDVERDSYRGRSQNVVYFHGNKYVEKDLDRQTSYTVPGDRVAFKLSEGAQLRPGVVLIPFVRAIPHPPQR